eukprot:3557167-Prymnesium_polylepis.1
MCLRRRKTSVGVGNGRDPGYVQARNLHVAISERSRARWHAQADERGSSHECAYHRPAQRRTSGR